MTKTINSILTVLLTLDVLGLCFWNPPQMHLVYIILSSFLAGAFAVQLAWIYHANK